MTRRLSAASAPGGRGVGAPAAGRGGRDGARLPRGARDLGGCSRVVWGQGRRGAAWGSPPALRPSLPPLPAPGCIISPRRSFACKHNQENIVAPFQALSDMAFLKRPVLSVCPPTSVCSCRLQAIAGSWGPPCPPPTGSRSGAMRTRSPLQHRHSVRLWAHRFAFWLCS